MLGYYDFYDSDPEQLMVETWSIFGKPENASEYINPGKCMRCFATVFKELTMVYNVFEVAIKAVREKINRETNYTFEEYVENTDFKFFLILYEQWLEYFDAASEIVEKKNKECFMAIKTLNKKDTSVKDYNNFIKNMKKVAIMSRSIQKILKDRFILQLLKIATHLKFIDYMNVRINFEDKFCY